MTLLPTYHFRDKYSTVRMSYRQEQYNIEDMYGMSEYQRLYHEFGQHPCFKVLVRRGAYIRRTK